MKTIFSQNHRMYDVAGEFNRGQLVRAFERPERADRVLAAIQHARLGPTEAPAEFPLAHTLRVHRPEFVEFLQQAYAQWEAAGRSGVALPIAWPIRALRSDRIPTSIDGRLSYYSFDVSTAITAGTWAAVKSGVDSALTGAQEIARGDARSMFSLSRPPGHHAASDFFGGYCFLNNAAIAAQYLRDNGASRVAILDVDYHHGNGTQEIFYRRSDVLYASIHADPATDYPYFLGYADETGEGEGVGFNLNFPLARGIDWTHWSPALNTACEAITAYGPDVVVVSLGVDTFKSDPLSAFRLDSEDFIRMGERIAKLSRPVLFVMEGGYAIDEIGTNVVNVLLGYESRAR